MIHYIVAELMDYFGFWGSPYFPLWSFLFEVFALFLFLLVILVPLFFVYHIIKIFGSVKKWE